MTKKLTRCAICHYVYGHSHGHCPMCGATSFRSVGTFDWSSLERIPTALNRAIGAVSIEDSIVRGASIDFRLVD
jgi:hypothetical protein